MVFAVFDGNVHQLGIFWLFGGSEDERGICGSILRLILSNGSKVTRVTDNCGANGFQLFEGASHDLLTFCVGFGGWKWWLLMNKLRE